MKKWGAFHKVCTRDGQACGCRPCATGAACVGQKQRGRKSGECVHSSPPFRNVLSAAAAPSPAGCCTLSVPCQTAHIARLITPHNVCNIESLLYSWPQAQDGSFGNPPRLEAKQPGIGMGGGGPRLFPSVNFNSSPHLKIFCATGSRLAPHLRALRLTRYWHATTFCPGA